MGTPQQHPQWRPILRRRASEEFVDKMLASGHLLSSLVKPGLLREGDKWMKGTNGPLSPQSDYSLPRTSTDLSRVEACTPASKPSDPVFTSSFRTIAESNIQESIGQDKERRAGHERCRRNPHITTAQLIVSPSTVRIRQGQPPAEPRLRDLGESIICWATIKN